MASRSSEPQAAGADRGVAPAPLPSAPYEAVSSALAALEQHRRDTLFESVAAAAKELLRSSDLTVSLPKVAEEIGSATGVDRTHIFLVDGSDGNGQILQHFLWTRAGLPTPAEYKNPSMPLSDVGLGSWIPRLQCGETIAGHIRDFLPEVHPLFELGGIKSTLCVPVFADGQWKGFIGFDDCRSERDWSAAEIGTIETLAEMVGSAIARILHQRELTDANHIIENSPTILYRLGPQSPFPLIYLSQNVSRYGYVADQLMASPTGWLRFVDSEYHAAIRADIEALVEGRTEQTLIEFRIKKADGSYAWLEGRGYSVRDDEGRLCAIDGILTDITDRRLAAEKIAALARTDPLTGLPNRVAFLERLTLEFARARRGETSFAVHYLDLDHFKDINDTLGHPVGDRLLCAVAGRLTTSVRATDMVARFGGDEFAVLQDDIDGNASVERLAVKIGAVIGDPYDLDGNQLRTSVSIGIVPYRSDIANIDAMMMKADLALFRAKNDGRNRFRMHVDQLDDETRERMVIGEDPRHAVARNEFELYYQPQIDMTAGEIVGLEALLRWNHPGRGQLLPDNFISVAETTGSITTIGAWVIGEACRQIADWREAGLVPPLVAINLSGAQFKLAARLDRIVVDNLARFMVAPDDLELELTESVLLETTERHGEVLTALRRAGVRLAIDDFGTGYSSLDYLRAFQATRLKNDRRFIENVTSNPDNAAITRATIGLAQALGIEVVAEGVETPAQRDFLLEAGCRLAQGFLFGRPMPSAQASALLPARCPSAAE